MANKIQIAAFSGLLFYVIANPITYSIVNSIFMKFRIPIAMSGKPTGTGLIVHALVFAAVTYALMTL